MSSQLVDKRGRLWQERTVIVKREASGFGFTLSQEMPVFVDKVFNNSSAQRAGILEGDRIIKVNSVDVVGHKHNEVVDMIRDSSFVTLTIIGKMIQNGTKILPPLSQTTSDNSHGIEISAPRHLQESTLQSLKTMLQKQRKLYESLSVQFSKQCTEKVEKDLKDCENIIKILEEEIAIKTPSLGAHIQSTTSNIQMLTGRRRSPSKLDDPLFTKKLMAANGNRDDNTTPMDNISIHRKSIGSLKLDSPKPTRSHTFSHHNGSASPGRIWSFKKDHSDDSDDDLSDEVASDAGPFSSLQELKGSPAHMAVFLHYLYLTKEPKHLLFYLVASGYQHHCKAVDILKQRGLDIYWTFFIEQSPLMLEVEEGMKQRILHILETEETVSKLKCVFVEVRESLTETIISNLANYRHKRVIGLAGMFGDNLLSNQMGPQKQIEVVLSILTPDLKQLLDEKGTSGVQECVKNHAIAACMATFIQDVLSSVRANVKVPSFLERIQSFTRSDILTKKGKKKKPLLRNGHSFQLTQFSSPTNCDQCGKHLWGVVYHAYQCSHCDINIHRYCCIQEMTAECAGQHKPKPARLRKPSMLSRKSSLPLVAQADESESGKWEGVGPSDSHTEDDDRQSPPIESISSPSFEASGEPELDPPSGKRLRSDSDPHKNMVRTSIVSDSEVNETTHTPSGAKEKLHRTNSEKLRSKPDSVERHLSEGTWSSDEFQLNKHGSLEAIVETPSSAGSKMDMVDEDNMKELLDDDIKEAPPAWAEIAQPSILEGMKKHEIQRQEYIRELVFTERTHLHKLKIMLYLYKVPLQRQNLLTAYQAEQLFPSLEELILFHSGLCADLKERVMPLNDGIVTKIADVLLQRFDGGAGVRLCHACSIFASNQAKAEKLFKDWRRKHERLRLFIKNTESHHLCHRLALTELMPIAWTRLTRYQLLIGNIIRSYKKDWDNLDDADKQECEKTETSFNCVKNILAHVNRQVKLSNEQQKLIEIQSKIEFVQMERIHHPIAKLYKSLDLSAENRWLIHDGPLTWKIQHRRVVELHALLFNDILVLLEKHEDKDKYFFRCHTVENISGLKGELSPVIRVQECLLRHAAADRGGRTFLLVNNSSLMNLAQMYEFMAESPSEKKQWEEAIKRAMWQSKEGNPSPDLPVSPLCDESHTHSTFTMHLTPREQLNKIDEDMKKLHNDKLNILRAMQSMGVGRSLEATPQHSAAKDDDNTVKGILWSTIEQSGDITSAVSHIMVPNPTKAIIAETQHRLTSIINELQKNLSRLLIITGGQSFQDSQSMSPLDLDMNSDGLSSGDTLEVTTPTSGRTSSGSGTSQDLAHYIPSDLKSDSDGGGDMAGSSEMLNIPSPIPEVDDEVTREESPSLATPLCADEDVFSAALFSPNSMSSSSSTSSQSSEGLTMIVAPPDIFSGDESVTPTPGMEAELVGNESGSSTPKLSDLHFADAMVSPLTVAQHPASPSIVNSTQSNVAQHPASPSIVNSSQSNVAQHPASPSIVNSTQSNVAQHPARPSLVNSTQSKQTALPGETRTSSNFTSNSNQELSRQGSPHSSSSTEQHKQTDSEINSHTNGGLNMEVIVTPASDNSLTKAAGAAKVVSVYTSSEHDMQPSDLGHTDEVIPTFSLSRKTDVDCSVSRSESYEGSDL